MVWDGARQVNIVNPDAEACGYPGSKAGSGVWQRIISEMPAHESYAECFLGTGAILRRKRRAPGFNVALDVDPWRLDQTAKLCAREGMRGVEFRSQDALAWLSHMLDMGMFRGDWLVYCDPPYLRSTRTRLLYDHEFATEDEHRKLLRLLLKVPSYVMLSGYPSALYAALLEEWRCIRYQTMTRGGLRTECLWCNFPAGLPLHDTRFVGGDFRERLRIKRKRDRWVRRLSAMPAAERQMIREALNAADGNADLNATNGAAGSRMKQLGAGAASAQSTAPARVF